MSWVSTSVPLCLSEGAQLVIEAHFTLPDHVIGLDSLVYHGETDPSLAVPGQCPLVSCSFENSDCGWRHTPPDFAWSSELNQGAPDGEHIFSTFFLDGDKARTFTGCLTLSGETEMTFWYLTSSNSRSHVELIVENLDDTTQDPIVLWTPDEGKRIHSLSGWSRNSISTVAPH